MILFKKAGDLHSYLETQQENGKSVGFVPTMGALHRGHLSLIERSKNYNDITVCSIFVNPAQFNDPADFKKYPVTIDQDIQWLTEASCDVLFLPAVDEVYPPGFIKKHYDLGILETVLEGKFRPGHFQGVCLVMDRLLSIVSPDHLYIGQKDYQQCMVISRLVEIMGMQSKIQITIAPTLREKDGLAMSSRNMRLNKEERQVATTIYQTLCLIKEEIFKQPISNIKKLAIEMLVKKGFKVDYVEIADAQNLAPIDTATHDKKMVALVAAFMNDVRLIDNISLN